MNILKIKIVIFSVCSKFKLLLATQSMDVTKSYFLRAVQLLNDDCQMTNYLCQTHVFKKLVPFSLRGAQSLHHKIDLRMRFWSLLFLH